MAKIAPAKETKEVAVIPVLEITPVEGMPIDGNFSVILSYLQRREKEIAKMKLTEDNIDQVKLIKKEATAYRTKIKDKLDNTVKLLFDSPKAVLKSRVQELFTAIENIEGTADKVLDKLEEDRIADLNKVLDAYKASFQEKYKLEEKYLSQVEYPKAYFNKTQEEKASKTDLEAQFIRLKKEQDAYAANVRLIKMTCKDEPRLNVQLFLEMLETKDVATITEQIIEEKQRLDGLDAEDAKDTEESQGEDGGEEAAGEPEAATDQKTTILGIASTLNFATDFPGRTNKKQFELEYPCDTSEAITELFQLLRPFGIITREIRQPAEVAF